MAKPSPDVKSVAGGVGATVEKCEGLLEESRRLRNLIFDSSAEGMAIISADGRILDVNRSYERILGQKRFEVVGKTAMEISLATGYRGPWLPKDVASDPAATLVNIRGETVLMALNVDRDEHGAVCHAILTLNNLSRIEYLKDQLERSAGRAFGPPQPDQGLHQLQEVLNAAGLGEALVAGPATQRVFAAAAQVATHDATVLLCGETGTGKGVVAKLIHRLSRRRGKPFVELNCGAIPEALVEAELFGYQPGTFTGSVRGGKRGLLELAHCGTLFLDEIGELQAHSQVKLLKFLDDKVILPLGSTSPKALDVRIIAATNAELRKLIRQGRFREDLLYRLEVMPISIPSLRERPEEIAPLAQRFLGKFNEEFGEERILSPEVLKVLQGYDFPGNVRELRNLIAQLVVSARAAEIRIDDLPDSVFPEHRQHLTRSDAVVQDTRSTRPAWERTQHLRKYLEEGGRSILERLAPECRSARELARRTGLHHSVVLRKLRKYDIQLSG